MTKDAAARTGPGDPVRRQDQAGSKTNEETETRDDPGGCPDDCLGCVGCLPLLAARRVPVPEGFTLAAYDLARQGEPTPPERLVAEAYGIALPDGRAVTYCEDPDTCGDPKFRIWGTLAAAAHYWGAWVLWPRFARSGQSRLG